MEREKDRGRRAPHEIAREPLANPADAERDALGAPPSRRDFLRVLGLGAALAGAASCAGRPPARILPYARQPEEVVPGRPLHYATALARGATATGVLVECHLGRPTKVSGNPDHPASLGATDPWLEAAVLDLWDPDRAAPLRHDRSLETWESLVAALTAVRAEAGRNGGAGLRILTGEIASPTLAGELGALLGAFPEARWHRWESLGDDGERAGSLLAFGRELRAVRHFDRAAVVVSLGADFLCGTGSAVRDAHDFAAARRTTGGLRTMSRLYAIESTPTLTGAAADHRLALDGPGLARFASALVQAVASPEGAAPGGARDEESRWIAAVARDLVAHRGAGLVVAGADQPAAVQAAAHLLNERLGNVGTTVAYVDPREPALAVDPGTIDALASDLATGKVATLIVLGGNPVYDAPADLEFARRLVRAPLTVHLGRHDDETSRLCRWHVPEAHPFETWSDARAFDGTASVVQPVTLPLFGGRSAHEVLAVLAGETGVAPYERVRSTWRGTLGEAGFDDAWRESLRRGVIPGTQAAAVAVAARPPEPLPPALGAAAPPVARPGEETVELLFRGDPSIGDGRFANNAWLQELPRPLTSLVWDNAVLLAPAAAARLGVANGDEVELAAGGHAVRGPAWILAGQADGVATVHLGSGRTHAGKVGTGVGFDAGPLRLAASLHARPGVTLRRTGARHELVSTQEHHAMEGRPLARVGTLAAFTRDPGFARDPAPPRTQPSLYPPRPAGEHAWGMSIDLGACIGCNACVVACQSENNVPVVGKREVARGREMHWIRVDRYASPEVPLAVFQPRPCMHCEDAPCELVCPVGATVHSPDGLNEMVYNRCIGTRYCSNNCPYKVRRFNFFGFAHAELPVIPAMANPDVTIRDRGVMEKCTYCVQRIQEARIREEEAGRPIRDGEVRTACQEACPAQAIVFGDLLDRGSEVAKRKSEPHDYAMLGELGTRPRTTYLARVRNPNPELEASA